MAKIPVQDAERQFASAIKPTQADLDLALEFMTEIVGDDRQQSDALIQKWWETRGAAPVPVLVLDDAHDFSGQLQQAARHWEARIAAARALQLLSSQDYFAVGDSARTVDRVKQDYTTAVDGSRAQLGTWNVDKFDVRYPASVYRSPFAEARQARTPAPQHESDQSLSSAPNNNPNRRVIGDDYDAQWYEKLPPGLPNIVRTAVAREKARVELRAVVDMLREASPATSDFEKTFVGAVIEAIENSINMLALGVRPSGEWLPDPNQVDAMQRTVSLLVLATMLMEGVVTWADAADLVRQALAALGVA